MTREADPAEPQALVGQFTDIGNGLQTAVSPMAPGPDVQPSSAAVTEVAASVNHLTRIAGFRLSGYVNNVAGAAATDVAATGG